MAEDTIEYYQPLIKFITFDTIHVKRLLKRCLNNQHELPTIRNKTYRKRLYYSKKYVLRTDRNEGACVSATDFEKNFGQCN